MTHAEKRILDIAQMEHETDSTIVNENIKYSLETNANKIAIISTYSGDLYYMDKSKSKVARISKWEFDKSGHALNYIPNINTPSSDISHYKYNAVGDLIEYKQNYSRFADRDLYKYKYDNNHRTIESEFYDGEWLLSITRFQYKSFDSNKNWTVRISRQKNHGHWGIDSSTDTVIRKITYY